jgi:hypothetical protein
MKNLVNLKNKNLDLVLVLVFLASLYLATPRRALLRLATPCRAVLHQQFELVLVVRLGFVGVRD